MVCVCVWMDACIIMSGIIVHQCILSQLLGLSHKNYARVVSVIYKNDYLFDLQSLSLLVERFDPRVSITEVFLHMMVSHYYNLRLMTLIAF